MAKTKSVKKAGEKTRRGEPSRSGKRQREQSLSEEDSPPPFTRKEFESAEKFSRYHAIRHKDFIKERRVELHSGQYDDFRSELHRRHWWKLASLPKYFNPEVVKYFYANAYNLDLQARRVSYVMGRRVRYDRDIISAYLEDHLDLEGENLCDFQNFLRPSVGFNYPEVLETICTAGTLMREGRIEIERAEMKTLTQIWMTFLLSNVIPTLHTSSIGLLVGGMIYCIHKQMKVDVAAQISDEIHRIATARKPVPLCFPSLITELCRYQKVIVAEQPQLKIRPPINESFIRHHCSEAEALPRPPPPPVDSTQAQIQQILLIQQQLQMQQTVMFTRQEHMYSRLEEIYVMLRRQDHDAWPEDRPLSRDGERVAGHVDGATASTAADFGADAYLTDDQENFDTED